MEKVVSMPAKSSITLVTGATSMLGRKVAERLMGRGDTVRTVLKETPRANEEWRMLPPGVVPYVADITLKDRSQKDTLLQACKGATDIFHIAGATYNYRNTYDQLIDVNVVGTENMLRAWLEANPAPARGRIIFTSSISVYGYNRPGETLHEGSEPKPAGPYSASKLMAERVIESWCAANPRLSYSIARLGTLYGEGYETSFFKTFELIKDGMMTYAGSGANHLTLIHVDDAVDALMEMHEKMDKSEGRTYNVTDGVAHTEKELFGDVARFMKLTPQKEPARSLFARLGVRRNGIKSDEYDFLNSDRVVSIERARKELGFEPIRSIEKEGREFVESFMATRARPVQQGSRWHI